MGAGAFLLLQLAKATGARRGQATLNLRMRLLSLGTSTTRRDSRARSHARKRINPILGIDVLAARSRKLLVAF